MTDPQHRQPFEVRDYECDMQGVVNNAIYQNYLEHSRHEFMKTMGIDIAEMARCRINLVVIRVELDYRRSLVSGDRFIVLTRLERVSKLRFAFHHQIIRDADGALMLEGKIIGTVLNEQNRPFLLQPLDAILG